MMHMSPAQRAPATPQQREGSASKMWRTQALSGSAPRRNRTPLRFKGQAPVRIQSATKSLPSSATKRNSFLSGPQTMDDELEKVMEAARAVLLRDDATEEERGAGVRACRAAFRGIRQRHPRADYSADYYVTCARFEEFCGDFEAVSETFARGAKLNAAPRKVLEAAFLDFLARQGEHLKKMAGTADDNFSMDVPAKLVSGGVNRFGWGKPKLATVVSTNLPDGDEPEPQGEEDSEDSDGEEDSEEYPDLNEKPPLVHTRSSEQDAGEDTSPTVTLQRRGSGKISQVEAVSPSVLDDSSDTLVGDDAHEEEEAAVAAAAAETSTAAVDAGIMSSSSASPSAYQRTPIRSLVNPKTPGSLLKSGARRVLAATPVRVQLTQESEELLSATPVTISTDVDALLREVDAELQSTTELAVTQPQPHQEQDVEEGVVSVEADAAAEELPSTLRDYVGQKARQALADAVSAANSSACDDDEPTTRVQFSPVRLTASQAAKAGAPTALTPVRRSSRLTPSKSAQKGADIAEMLEETGYTFKPNPLTELLK